MANRVFEFVMRRMLDIQPKLLRFGKQFSRQFQTVKKSVYPVCHPRESGDPALPTGFPHTRE